MCVQPENTLPIGCSTGKLLSSEGETLKKQGDSGHVSKRPPIENQSF